MSTFRWNYTTEFRIEMTIELDIFGEISGNISLWRMFFIILQKITF